MDGIIVLDKPLGLSSAKALYRVRARTGQRKSGHAGTLDPLAEGVLLLCLGKATKLVESLMDLHKVYRATARMDVTSFSFDAETPFEPVAVAVPPDIDAVNRAAETFVGRVSQVPPSVSALKVRGRPAYRLARAGKPPELPPRLVDIYGLRTLRYEWPELEFELTCGRGTYVRALIRDWGAQLGAGGCLTALARTSVGSFTRERAATFGRIEREPAESWLIPLDQAVQEIEASLAGNPYREGDQAARTGL
jgi:tRNA pseudouridine55 synthase